MKKYVSYVLCDHIFIDLTYLHSRLFRVVCEPSPGNKNTSDIPGSNKCKQFVSCPCNPLKIIEKNVELNLINADAVLLSRF